MTQTFGTTAFPANDIYVNASGNIEILQAQPAIEAACQSASLLQLGEAVLATASGIPYFESVFNGTPSIAVFESYLRTAITNINGVLGIQSLTVSKSGNTLSYSATIQSIYGTAEIISQEIPLS